MIAFFPSRRGCAARTPYAAKGIQRPSAAACQAMWSPMKLEMK
jgi:hypothetical protein